MNEQKKKTTALLSRLDWLNSIRGKVVRRHQTPVRLIATIDGKKDDPPQCRVMDANGDTVDVPFSQIGQPKEGDETAFGAAFQVFLRAKDAAKTKARRSA